jgi:NADH dehydrogenase
VTRRPRLSVVTGAFSYTGSHIATQLLAGGERVRTLSRRPEPGHPLSGRVEHGTLQFSDVGRLRADLRGADTLYNTYWIRFPRDGVTWDDVLANTRTLLGAAREAGVRRVVHLSVTGADERSPLPYYRAKALAERAVREAGLASHAIVRPTLVFGRGDILVTNIAWLLRRLPVLVLPAGGAYRLQPVAVEDVAALAIALGRRGDDVTRDAAGPETMTFAALIRAVRAATGARCRLARAPAGAALALSAVAGRVLGDVLVTRDELAGVMAGLLVSREPPAGRRRLAGFLASEGEALGRAFVSERRRNWPAS